MPSRIIAMRWPGAVPGAALARLSFELLMTIPLTDTLFDSARVVMAGVLAPSAGRGDFLLPFDEPRFGEHAEHFAAVGEHHLADRETRGLAHEERAETGHRQRPHFQRYGHAAALHA